MKYEIESWWKKLSEKEKEILIEVLWKMDLTEYGVYSDTITGEYRNDNM